MKKLFQLLTVVLVFFVGAQAAYANSDKETVLEGADVTSVHRIALGMPQYNQVNKDAPNKTQLSKILYDASSVSHADIVSYNTVADGINDKKGVDILALNRRTAAKIFKENVADYADAYIILTVANNSQTTFFFDIYKSGTNQLLYTYEITKNRSEPDTEAVYKNLCEQFYKHFDRAVTSAVKDGDKAAKQDKKKKKDKVEDSLEEGK